MNYLELASESESDSNSDVDIEPEPFVNDSHLHASIKTISEQSQFNKENTTKLIIKYRPIIPLPDIPDTIDFIDKNNLEFISSKFPKKITALSNIEVILKYNSNLEITAKDTLNKLTSLHSIFKNTHNKKLPESITIIVQYGFAIDCCKKNCLSISKSIGESAILTNKLLNIPDYHSARNANNRNQNASTLHSPQTIIQSILPTSFQLFPTYEQELEQLTQMGFHDERLNYILLNRTLGNLEATVNILIN